MKALIYGSRPGLRGYVRNEVANGSISSVLEMAQVAERVVICNVTCAVVMHLVHQKVYFDCMTEETFTRVETALLKPYTKVHGGKLSVGRENDPDMLVRGCETVLLNYAERAKRK